MKKSLISTLLVLIAATFSLQGYAQQSYKLIWKENFNGKTFNSKHWSKIPRGNADWNRHMSDYDGCYQVKKGNLILRCINNTVCPTDTSRFLTGGLWTKGSKHISYGKVEVRAKLQGAQGFWPAIWMLPETGKWPDAGEIDIMERLNHDSIAYQTIHTHYTFVLKQENNPPHGGIGNIDPNNYNTYAVEILPDSICFSINGIQTLKYPRIETNLQGQYPFGTPFYLLIDTQIEGSWVGKANPKELPAEMWIDWVKMYELESEE